MPIVAITRENVGRVTRWRGERSGIRTYLKALMDGEWCQVVETRSDPDCLPPRRLRLQPGDFAWRPAPARYGGQKDSGEPSGAG